MARRKQALTDVQIRKIKKAGRFTDGDGLDLMATQGVAGINRKWVCRLTIKGKRFERGLGPYPEISLAEAREIAMRYRGMARKGIDPRVATLSVIPTFAEAAQTVFEINQKAWENEKHRKQWMSTLQTYAFPHIGKKQVDEIEPPSILEVLQPIWLELPETSARVKQRISMVFDWTIAKGYRTHNPVDAVRRGLSKRKRRVKHMASLPYEELPDFMKWLRGIDRVMASLALEFTVLTACRTGEVINATWGEFDLDNALWTIPAERMKMRTEHRVALSPAAVAILERLKPLSDGYVFPSPAKPGKPLGETAMLMFLRRQSYKITVHGFRATFRNWCAEKTGFPTRAVEVCLSHQIKDSAEAAYHRSDYLEKRREIMAAWAGYLDETEEKIVRLRS